MSIRTAARSCNVPTQRRAGTDGSLTGSIGFDFTAWMRARPTWDIIVLTLMLGGLASAVTGFYLAIRRIRQDVVLMFRFIARRKVAIADS